MAHKRNTLGLATAAKSRRQDTIKRVNDALKTLAKQNKVINFNAVAKVAGVGKTWLYKEAEIRKQILQYRESTLEIKILSKTPERTSAASKDALIKMLQNRVREVEAENRELKKQIEVLYGQL